MESLIALDVLQDAPTLSVEIGGRAYPFKELDVAALGRLQAWIRTFVPNPVDAIKPHLAGLPEAAQTRLAEKAYEDAAEWPPRVGTPAGGKVLLGTREGQVQVFYEGLRASDRHATLDQASALYNALERSLKRVLGANARARAENARAEKDGRPDRLPIAPVPNDAGRIYAVLFGGEDPGPIEGAAPKP